jgi:hypothetical protein
MIEILLYIGSVIIILWGIGHLIPTKNIVKGFGKLTNDNKKIITMEWIAEGLTLIFLGVLVFVVPSAALIAIIMLLVLAILSLFTGARTSVLPMKLCPAVKTIVAILFIIGIAL